MSRLVPRPIVTYRTLWFIPEREARHPERRRILLHPAGVDPYHRRVHLQAQEIEVAQELYCPDFPQEIFHPGVASRITRAGMDREDDRQGSTR